MFQSYIKDYNNSVIKKITDKFQKDVSTSVLLLFSSFRTSHRRIVPVECVRCY